MPYLARNKDLISYGLAYCVLHTFNDTYIDTREKRASKDAILFSRIHIPTYIQDRHTYILHPQGCQRAI